MKPAESRLTAILFRAFCPETSELGEYHFELSPPDRAAFIHDHLQECPHCRRELQQLKKFLQDVSPDLEYSPMDRFKIWVAEKLPRLSDASRPLAFGLRGGSTSPIFYQAGEAQITIEVQDDPDASGNKLILGLVIGIDPDDLQVRCFRAGVQVSNNPVDEFGNFVLAGLEPGEYDLLLQNNELEIQIQALPTQE
jgi:hypothetical protein